MTSKAGSSEQESGWVSTTVTRGGAASHTRPDTPHTDERFA